MIKNIKVIVVSVLLSVSMSSSAGIIHGGSDLLTSAYHQQLEDWLAIGDIDLTNIYDKATGDTTSDFHSAVDGRGATFTLMEISNGTDTSIIGGYNALSWSSINNYNYDTACRK